MRRWLAVAGLVAVAAAACSGSGSTERPASGTGASTSTSEPAGATTTVDEAAVLAVPPLPTTGGCGDVFFYAVSADATVGLVVSTKEPARGGGFSGSAPEFHAHYELPSDRLGVRVEIGNEVNQPYCNDVISTDHRIDVTRDAVAGTVDVDADAGECPVSGRASLHGVVVDAGGRRLQVPDMVIPADGLGCFAG
jgi:hypothetical protein